MSGDERGWGNEKVGRERVGRGNEVMVGERLSDHCCGLEKVASWMLCGLAAR